MTLLPSIYSDNHSKRLLDYLLSNYDNVVRPVMHESERINVYLGMKLSQIADIVYNQLIYDYSIIFLMKNTYIIRMKEIKL